MNPRNTEINLLTKECIAIASAKLLMADKDITITSICQKAGVSRNAFYRNFDSIDDVFIYYLILGWAEYSKENKVEEEPQSEIGKHLIRYFYSKREFVKALKTHNQVHLVEQLFVKVIVPSETNGATRYILYGTAYFTYGLIRAMIDNDFKDSPEEIERMFLSAK